MKTFSKLLHQFNDDVTNQQLRLSAERTRWEKQKDLTAWINQNANQILYLDIGGSEIHTSQLVMNGPRAHDSMLGVWLSGQFSDWWELKEEQEDGLVFVDRDGETFRTGILDWLRDGDEHLLFHGPGTTTQRVAAGNQAAHFLWKTKQADWVATLHTEATYFGLAGLEEWCSNTTQFIKRLSTGVVSHYLARHAEQDWFPSCVADPPALQAPSGWLISLYSIGLHHRVSASSGTKTFFIEVLPSGVHQTQFDFGFNCECGYQVPPPEPVEGVETFVLAYDCPWYCNMGIEVCGCVGDVFGAHLGKFNLADKKRTQCVWLTKNGEIIWGPNTVESHKRAAPQDTQFLVPYISITQGRVLPYVDQTPAGQPHISKM
eukprot:TRINITY_DN105515_c0_g1_i1.p1 TRINITY_DN105515_c0_g1~~TRINITY_DN105515_c0_g1_i1.p1  ORF type:complete len:374 (-),score=26.10 TRINITY_DN105515_c0_g1_i1:12-1133(-)